LPEFGQIFALHRISEDDSTVEEADIVSQVALSTGLPAGVANRVVQDVVAFFHESVEDYVRRRHTRLQAAGGRNPEIFAAIARELDGRLVAAPRLSERQLRRIVYG
jgi:hypothetical protein